MSKNVLILAVLLLALAPGAWAQVKSGEASMNLSGTISAGYTNDTSNVAGSDHGIFGAGVADFSGSYFNPNFLSFDVQPFYNQSRLNSTFQSLTAASGVSASAKIFGGSDFPGMVNYSTVFNSTGNFGIPGLANYTTNGNSNVLGLGWGVHVKGYPTLNLNFTNANNTYSIYGTNTLGSLHADTFSANSNYRLAGFNLNGGYQHTGTQGFTPEFLTPGLPQRDTTGANSFYVGVGHSLPWNGSFTAGATRLDISSNYGDSTSSESYNTTVDTVTGALNFNPTTRLNLGANAFYTDNLNGTLYNTLLTAGVVLPQGQSQFSSHDATFTGIANYQMPQQHLTWNAFVERQQQTFMGVSFASNSYSGTGIYSNTLLGGQFNGVLGVTGTTFDTGNENLLGLNASVNYSHRIRQWTAAGSFTYSQDNQTLLANYTTSGYYYTGNVGRRLRRRWYWNAAAGGQRSLLTAEPGTANTSQNYSTSISLPRFSISGSYSDSTGNALLTTTGLVTTPIPVTVVPSAAVVLFTGKSYSVGVGSNPVRGLTFSASFAKALSSTNSNSTLSNNNNEIGYVTMLYHLRKLDFESGYSRLIQGFSITGAPPTRVGSFFVGVSRAFNFF